jgi:hypothetical protein
MKNIKLTLLGAAALLIAVALNVRHALNDYGIKDNKLHVEVLAQSNGSGGGGGSSSGGVEDCDITKYTRNAREKYVTTEIKYNTNIGMYATVGTRTVAGLSIYAEVGGSVGIPDCEDKENNCCKKSFIENAPKYY